MTTATKAPVLIDTFTFSTRPDGVVDIMQHYAEPTEGGAVATPIGYIKKNSVEWTCESAPLPLARLIGFGIMSSVDKVLELVQEAEEDIPGTFIHD